MTFGPVSTVWASTTTSTSTLDCGQCTHIEPLPIGPGPQVRLQRLCIYNVLIAGNQVIYTATETLNAVLTLTTHVCEQPRLPERRNHVVPNEGSTAISNRASFFPTTLMLRSDCTANTVPASPAIPPAPTSTQYMKAVIEDKAVDCHDCASVE